MPLDYDRVLALVAPRPVLIVAPTVDRYVCVEVVQSEVEQARKVYEVLGRNEALRLETPLDFNRFILDRQEQVINWITQQR